MRSLFSRYLAFSLALLFFSFTIFGVCFIWRAHSHSANELHELLAEDSAKIGELSAMLMENLGDSKSQQMFLVGLNAILRNSEEIVIVCNSEGNALFYADGTGLQIDPGYIVHQEMMEETENGGFYSCHGTMDGILKTESYICGRAMLDRAKQVIGAVYVAAPSTSASDMVRDYVRIFLIVGFFVMSLTVVVSYFTAQNMTRPISEMSKAAKRFAQGDFTARVPAGRNDEIGDLCRAFNSMGEAVSQLEEMRSSFIANVSHELKTPMTTIAGFADGILDGTIPPEKQSEYLTIIANDTRRLSRLVVRMLEASRVSSGEVRLHRTSFDLCELVRLSLVQRETRIDEKHLQVEAYFEEDEMYAYADEDNITQVIYNLTDNAIKYAEEGGTLSVKVTRIGQKLCTEVSNTGPCIPPEQLSHVFDRFYKLDSSRGKDSTSAGLGLFIVRSILNLHGEDITVTSENDVTTFAFMLPVGQGRM